MGRYLRRAEDLGFDSAVTIDHLLITPNAYACTWLEPMTMLAALAGVTRTIRLGTMVLVLPLRNPVYFAKEWATLDLLSGGRSILGLGVGWHEDEFALMGVPYRERGPRTSEAIEVLKALWAGDGVTYEGKYYRFRNLTIDPKPVQQPHPPIWIGGGPPSEKVYGQTVPDISPVLRRIAKYADTWVPHSSATPEMVKGDWAKVQASRARPDAIRPASVGCTRTSSGCSSPASGRSRPRRTSRSTPAWTSTTGRRTTCSAPRKRSRRGSARGSPRSTGASIRSSSTRSTGGSSSSS
jgi:probable F420-dependent oxidoreductase